MSQLTTLEYDRTLIPVLEQELAEFSQVEIRAGNILDINWDTEAEPDIPLMLFGNLPYHLSSDIILSLIDSPKSWRRACFMVQKEFKRKTRGICRNEAKFCTLSAAPITRIYIDCFLRPTHRFRTSTKSRLLYHHYRASTGRTIQAGVSRAFRTVVRALFGQRRKMARRALKTLDVEPQHLLANAGMDGSRRGETFNLDN